MTFLTDRIQINITRQTVARIAPNFGNILLLGNTHTPDPSEEDDEVDTGISLVETYTNLASVSKTFLPPIFDSSGNASYNAGEYNGAVSIFSQNPRPRSFMIGQVNSTGITSTYNQIVALKKNNFYGLVTTPTISTNNILELSAQVEADADKILFVGTNSTAVRDDLANNLAAQLKNLGRTRTAVAFNTFNNINPIMPALASLMLSKPIGSATCAWKRLSNVIEDSELDAGDIATLAENNVNYYINTGGGQGGFFDGKTATGAWIDAIMGGDFLKFAMRRQIVNLFQVNDIVPYTYEGAAMLHKSIKDGLMEAVRNKIILPNFTIDMPPPEDQSVFDKDDRFYPNITCDATFSNAIHKVGIDVNIHL